MSADRVQRVRYFDGQFLRTDDFTDEQAYHVAMRRRHALSGHSWGIVRGLDLVPGDRAVTVSPGVAIDGYGREIVLTAPLPVPPPDAGVAFDVWLLYDRIGTDAAPQACGPDGAFRRWAEVPRLRVEEAAADDPGARTPPGVPAGDLEFTPERTPPEEDRSWPVFLGRVRRDPADPATGFVVEGGQRPYAGLRGDRLDAASGRASIALGTPQPGVFVFAGADPDPVFAVTAAGAGAVRGDLGVAGELTVAGSVVLTDPVADPDTPRPWQVYRAQGASGAELRVELPPGAANRLVVGSWDDEASTFAPALTVDGAGLVTVHGALDVNGVLTARNIVKPGFDAEASRLVTAAGLAGITGASTVAIAARGAADDPGGGDTPDQIAGLAAAVAAALASEPALLDQFGATLRTRFPDAAVALADALREA